MARGNMHKKFGEVRPDGFWVTCADRPTDTDRQKHSQTYLSQYFVTLTGQSNYVISYKQYDTFAQCVPHQRLYKRMAKEMTKTHGNGSAQKS